MRISIRVLNGVVPIISASAEKLPALGMHRGPQTHTHAHTQTNYEQTRNQLAVGDLLPMPKKTCLEPFSFPDTSEQLRFLEDSSPKEKNPKCLPPEGEWIQKPVLPTVCLPRNPRNPHQIIF